MNPDQALQKAVSLVGGYKPLGEGCDVSKAAAHQWGLPGRKVPAEKCPTIERLTNGEVRCEDLRPDIDWASLRKPASARKKSVTNK